MALPKRDPGPCPVDDCPHTACTSDDYVPGAVLTVVALPARDQERTPRSRLVLGVEPHGEISTRTYSRAAVRKIREAMK